MGETNNPMPIVTHNGVEVLECFSNEGIWQIEQCRPKSNTHYLALQKNTKHYYKAKIISKQIDHGIHILCYVGD